MKRIRAGTGCLTHKIKIYIVNIHTAIAYLVASAEMGNQYAAQLFHSLRSNRNWSAATGTLRLLHHINRILQNHIDDERKGRGGGN